MKRKIGLDVGDKTVGIAVSDPLGITAQGLMTLERVGIRKDTGKILDLVKEGFGVSFMYKVLAESDPDIATFTFQGEPIVREFNIVYLKRGCRKLFIAIVPNSCAEFCERRRCSMNRVNG